MKETGKEDSLLTIQAPANPWKDFMGPQRYRTPCLRITGLDVSGRQENVTCSRGVGGVLLQERKC